MISSIPLVKESKIRSSDLSSVSFACEGTLVFAFHNGNGGFMKKFVGVIFLFSIIVGCVEIQDQEKENPKVSSLTYEIEALAQPQSYLVRFSGIDCEKRATKITRSKSEQAVQLSQCSEILNEPGLYSYQFLEGTMQVEVPEDVVIKGHVQLSDLKPKEVELKTQYTRHLKIAGRLYLEPGSVLSTNGESVLIEADLISSDGGRLTTFLDSANTNYTQNGKSGGLIHLKTNKIHGSLEIVLKGQNGGDGEPGFWATHKKVEDLILDGGHGGNSGRFFLEAIDDSMSLVKITNQPGAAGAGAEIRTSCVLASSSCRPRLLRPKGADGKPGLQEKSCLIKNNQCLGFT